MQYEETEDFILSKKIDIAKEFQTIELLKEKAMVVDEEQGILFILEHQCYVFFKETGWDQEQVDTWLYNLAGHESFQWVGNVEIPEGTSLIRGEALHPVKTYHPKQWPVVRTYLEEELKASAKTLTDAVLSLDHFRDLSSKVLSAEYEDGAIEFVAECCDDSILEKIRNGDIKHVSVEFDWKILEKLDDGSIAPKDIKFTGLTLLEKIPPGDLKTTVEVWEGVMKAVGEKRRDDLGEFLSSSKRKPAEEFIKVTRPKISAEQLSLEERLEWSLLKDRAIIFHGEVGYETSEKALKRLEFLAKESNEPIHIILNSVGGGVYNGLLVFDTIKKIVESGTEVICEARGLAASMGCILLQAGTKRHATQNTRFLIHEVSSWTWGSMSKIEDQVEELKKVNDILVNILAERTGRSAEEIRKIWHKKDVWMSSEEAKKFKLIDDIVTTNVFTERVKEYAFLMESSDLTKLGGITMQEAIDILGEPFAGYKNMDACVASNKNKKGIKDPAAYCAAIMRKVEKESASNKENKMFQQIADTRKNLTEAMRSAETFKGEAATAKISLLTALSEVEDALPNNYILRLGGPTAQRTAEAVRLVLRKYGENPNEGS